jgi:uncharacterized Zn finger protein
MTTAKGVCAHCGAVGEIASLVVYLEAPGTVARCRDCGEVVMVVVDHRGIKCVDLRGLRAIEPAD